MRIIIFIVIVLRFLQTLAYISLFHFSFIKLKEPKRKRITITFAIYIMAIVAYFAVLFHWGQRMGELLIMPVEIGLCIILLVICSADKWRVSLFVMFTQFNLLLGISYLADICSSDQSVILYQIEYFMIRTVLFGALLFLNFKFLRPRFRRLVEIMGKEWYFVTLAAFSFYILEAVLQYYPRMYWYEGDSRGFQVASSYLVLFSVYWLIFRSIVALVGNYEVQARERILAQQNKLWEEQIEEQKIAVNSARRDRHDLRHHYDTLLTMLEGGKTVDAVAYLNTQTQRMESRVFAGICEHPAANAILSRWEARARENGILTEIEARIPADIPMDGVALVGILANAFENAVEGCQRCPDNVKQFITAKIAYSVYNGAGKLHIVIENSCLQNLEFENSLPKSLKAGGGTGTKSIAYTTEKYHGMVDFTAENGVFKMRVLLHL